MKLKLFLKPLEESNNCTMNPQRKARVGMIRNVQRNNGERKITECSIKRKNDSGRKIA